jgi:hypothetical protein
MALSVKGQSKMVRFIEDREGHLLHEGQYKQNSGRVEVLHFKTVETTDQGKESAVERYRRTTFYDECENITLMTEIQLKNIVERLQKDEKDTKTDGDETMVKNGVTISKFSCDALGFRRGC